MTGYYTVFDEHTTLGEWLMYWLETYVRPTAKPSSYSHYRDNCEKHIIPALGEVPIGEISAKMLQRFFNEQARTGNLRNHGPLSTKSMRNMRVVLDVAFKQAVSEDVVSHNPVPLTAIKSPSLSSSGAPSSVFFLLAAPYLAAYWALRYMMAPSSAL